MNSSSPQNTPENQDISIGNPKNNKNPQANAQFENLRRFFGKAAALAILTMLATSCEKETPEEIVSNQAPQNKVFTATVVDADGDGEKNDVQLNFTATDDKAVTSKKVLLTANEYSKTIDFGTATEKMIKNLENAEYAAEFVAKDEQGLADSDTKNFKVEVETPLSLDISVAVNKANVNEGENIKDIVFVTLDNVNNTAGVSYEVTQGGDYFTTVDNQVVGKDTQLDFEALNKKITVEVTAKADGQADATKTFTIDVNDQTEVVENLNLPDVTYKKAVWNPDTKINETDPTDITQDLSYTSTGNADGHPVMRKVDVADQDPNTTNIQEEVLKELDADGNPVYESYATALARLENASVGDATINDIMISLAANNYKIAEFTTYDRNGKTQLKNKHGVEIHKQTFAQAYMNMVETLGLSDDDLRISPNQDPANKENIQKLHVGMRADFFKKLQSITADLTEDQQIALIKRYGVQAFGRANTMTYDERNAAMVVTIGKDALDNSWK